MKKTILFTLLVLISMGNVFASPFTNKKVEIFFESLKVKDYKSGIEELLTDTILEEKVLNVTQTKNNWISQFQQINSLYGDYWSYEHIMSTRLGNLEESYYFLYCEEYVVQLVLTEYKNKDKSDLINVYFDDQVLETLQKFGKVN